MKLMILLLALHVLLISITPFSWGDNFWDTYDRADRASQRREERVESIERSNERLSNFAFQMQQARYQREMMDEIRRERAERVSARIRELLSEGKDEEAKQLYCSVYPKEDQCKTPEDLAAEKKLQSDENARLCFKIPAFCKK